MPHRATQMLLIALVACGALAAPAEAGTRLKNICRVKGQETNSLQGLGLVVGLKGTGDGGRSLPTMRMLATSMQLLGNPIGPGGPEEMKDFKNVAVVMVTATVPAAGGREGDLIDCTVSSIGGAKSLAGGRLFLTALQGPQVESTRVYATAQGSIYLEDGDIPTTGRIHRGCRLEADFFNPYTQDNRFTLVLNESHADFEVAQAVADTINRSPLGSAGGGVELALAINQGNVVVVIPPEYRADPVNFIAQVLALEILLGLDVKSESRVVINERAGSVVIDGEVEIGSVVVTHKNMVVQTGENVPGDPFVALHIGEQPPVRLQSLLETLNAVKVPQADIIDIIRGLESTGKLHAKLIIE